MICDSAAVAAEVALQPLDCQNAQTAQPVKDAEGTAKGRLSLTGWDDCAISGETTLLSRMRKCFYAFIRVQIRVQTKMKTLYPLRIQRFICAEKPGFEPGLPSLTLLP